MIDFELASEDPDYPEILRQIDDSPKRLWGQGGVHSLAEGVCVAVVGSRACSRYGEETAFSLARDLARAGVTVVSGLAYGIDAAAHQGALEGGGKTIAVLGCGIDVPYPARNQDLKNRIVGQGAVISELPPGTQAAPWTFPRRNRIISGLSRGVVVVEAGLKRGSLITADFALQQGREVFAVPGMMTSATSGGTHRLIQNGAKLVMSVGDILEELRTYLGDAPLASTTKGSEAVDPEVVDPDDAAVLTLLAEGAKHIDVLVEKTGFSIEKISALLVKLEIGDKIGSLPGGRFVRRS